MTLTIGARLDQATSGLPAPLAVVDLDALEANADDLVRRAGGVPIRVASKSVRVRAVLQRVLARDGFAGVMARSSQVVMASRNLPFQATDQWTSRASNAACTPCG